MQNDPEFAEQSLKGLLPFGKKSKKEQQIIVKTMNFLVKV